MKYASAFLLLVMASCTSTVGQSVSHPFFEMKTSVRRVSPDAKGIDISVTPHEVEQKQP